MTDSDLPSRSRTAVVRWGGPLHIYDPAHTGYIELPQTSTLGTASFVGDVTAPYKSFGLIEASPHDPDKAESATEHLADWWLTAASRRFAPADQVSELAVRLERLEAEHEASRLAAHEPSRWFVERIFDILSWGANWDDDGAEAISATVAKRATAIAAKTSRIAAEPEPIAVTDGSLQLLWVFSPTRFATLDLEQKTDGGDFVFVADGTVTSETILRDSDASDALEQALSS